MRGATPLTACLSVCQHGIVKRGISPFSACCILVLYCSSVAQSYWLLYSEDRGGRFYLNKQRSSEKYNLPDGDSE
jgi:hypothetical protein